MMPGVGCSENVIDGWRVQCIATCRLWLGVGGRAVIEGGMMENNQCGSDLHSSCIVLSNLLHLLLFHFNPVHLMWF